jgi:DNA-binding NarL/FixJ family response regulator
MSGSSKIFKVFVLSDQKMVTTPIANFLEDYQKYELHFIPTELNLFDLLKFEPDIIIMDQKVRNVVKCYEWEAA